MNLARPIPRSICPGVVTARDVTQLARDPFGRCNGIKRRIENPPVDGCAWCGYMCRTPKSNRPYLYQYGTEYDSGKQFWNSRLFCQMSCFRSFTS